MKKAQIASTDIILALVIFVVAGAVFFSLLVGRADNDATSRLDREGDVLITDLVTTSPGDANDVSVASSGSLNKNGIEKFAEGMTDDDTFYQDLKSELGIKGDYCIHFETENGSIIYLHELLLSNPELAKKFVNGNLADAATIDDINAYGIGSERIEINGLPCKDAFD